MSKKIFVDVDNTITITKGTDYENCSPLPDKIKIINNLHDLGYEITYWTARGSVSKIDYYDLTKSQLDRWGAKYDRLMLGKPAYDLFIDDKTINQIEENLLEWLHTEKKD